ncbi:glycoside hydrolase family 15 protein [Ramlibacter alkalitolerans]|uniref:Glycoside hydrolase family 15 protein n=1 Tax=Ramlibacter alkalitolerans TaxID=2039631 RepID=A0ABS1JWP2_9BURK|nr:glycoside hydrolase family 15 protein [Ramlibacter alkalitolerans]MBL0428617.1 glycoside hydrolase family 15 protein [Ramlibacter alkalitolerans]
MAYAPIEDHALLADCHGAALVTRTGDVDWCCFGRFDAEPVLWGVLDARQGGRFQLAPVRPGRSERAYLPETFALRTLHHCDGGTVAITDFMPARRRPDSASTMQPGRENEGMLVRMVEGLAGRVELQLRFAPPAAGFADAQPADARLYCDTRPDQPHGAHEELLQIGAGERRTFVLSPPCHQAVQAARAPQHLLDETSAFWEGWCARCAYSGDYADAVRRSALTLKALTYAPTGAIVAAASTSLPEQLGGVRNWDYRYTWLRDASMVLQAFATLGYTEEARQFCGFLQTCCANSPVRLQVLYGIGGEIEVGERCLAHVEGHRGSRPVRVGNAAAQQVQIDIYGELADWALAYQQLGAPLDEQLARVVRGAADHVARHWAAPDQGIWELRDAPRHNVHSKAFAWVALDRAIRMLGPQPAWEQARAEVLQWILRHGLHRGGTHLVQAAGSEQVDASLLTLPLLDLPLDAGLLARTVSAVQEQLQDDCFVLRYRNPDGLPGSEGAFLICSFWLVDALLATGRADEARRLFERLLGLSNDLGLFAEEVQAGDGSFLGNFPQAFTHLALVNSAVHLELHKHGGDAALRGTQADRAARAVRLTGARRL